MDARRYRFGPFLLDTGRGTLLNDGSAVAIGNRAFQVLQALLSAQGEVVTKNELMAAAWPKSVVEESNLSVQVAALRKALGPSPYGNEWVVTVARVGYRFLSPATTQEGDDIADAIPLSDLSHKPSIAVLPLINLSGDPEQEYLADGITEDIITALSRFRWFFVIARQSSFAYKGKTIDVRQVGQQLGVGYVLEGSVRKSSQRIRISVQLIDAASGNHIWAERYDFDLVEILSAQDQIAEQVAGAIEPELLKTASASSPTRRGKGNISAWDLVRQGTFFFHQVTRSTHQRARELFQKARELNPDLPEAHIWLARVSAGIVAYGWSDSPEAELRQGLEAAVKAIHMEEKSPYAHYALAITSVYAGELDQAIRAAERAVDLSPSFALGHLVLGMARLFSGEAAAAILPLQHGLRLNPYDPQNFVWYNLLALAYLFANEPQKAIQCAVTAAQIRPTWRPALETMACSNVALGHLDAARQYVRQMLDLEKTAGDALDPFRLHNPNWSKEMKVMLRKAGFDE